MWVEMLNSNQALMETNLQGAVAVAIVTAARLETQTRLLLDSFGAPVSTQCQGRGSRRAGVHPWPWGTGSRRRLRSAPGAAGFCAVGSPRWERPVRACLRARGKRCLGGRGPWDEPWGLAHAGMGRAEPGRGARAETPQPRVGACPLTAKPEGPFGDGEPWGRGSGMRRWDAAVGCSGGMQDGTRGAAPRRGRARARGVGEMAPNLCGIQSWS